MDTAAEARNVELQEECAGECCESRLENEQFPFPRPALLDIEVVGVRCSQGAEDMVRFGR